MKEKRQAVIDKVKLALLAMQRYSWEQGVAMQAFMEQGDVDVVIAMAKEAAYRRIADGRTAVIGNQDAVTDPCSVGEALLFAANKTQDVELMQAHQDLLEWALKKAPRNQSGTVYHIDTAAQFWVDSFYMLPPYLAAAGYYDEAIQQIEGYWNALYDPNYQLLRHIWDDENQLFIREVFWGVGNGWAMAGIARVIDLLPAEYEKEKQSLIEKATILIQSVAKYLRSDGFTHDILDDEESFVETNLPQMFAYTIYRGVQSGWLEADWKQLADGCREAVWQRVDAFGLVQQVCGAPDFIRPGVAPEGQAFFLLMEAAAN